MLNPASAVIMANKLPQRPEKRPVRHHPSIPFKSIPTFMAALSERDELAALGLRLLVLSGLRSKECREARWEEFDMDDRVWNVPASRMKKRVAHRIPLPDQMMDVIEKLAEIRTSEYLLPSHGKSGYISDGAFAALMKRMEVSGASPHGFRASLKAWGLEAASHPEEIMEACIAHKMTDAYNRGDLLNRRRLVMRQWADHCTGVEAKVVQLYG